MFFSLMALAAAAASMQAEPVNNARRAYSDCLQSYLREQLQQRTEPAAFEAAHEGRPGGNRYRRAGRC